jgi:anti-sigma factor RsiW
MSDHLSSLILNALADGELSADQLAATNQHLAGCPACTSSALSLTLLKSATAKAGKRFVPDSDLQARILQQIRQNSSPQSTPRRERYALVPKWRLALYGWATALALLLVSAGVLFVQHRASRSAIASAQYAALATEVCDRHVATLAANEPPQVISSDRHTVKPWFQGKLPFSFNLPEDLPSGTTLDGANLTYIQNKPAAQLLYSIGKHHVSVYLEQKTSSQSTDRPATDHSGFHVVSFSTRELDGIAVSDVDPSRLSDLVSRFKSAQN